MSVARVLACLLLVTLAATNETTAEEEEPEFKCLHCESTTDIMCFNNASCNTPTTGHRYCYLHITRIFNESKSKWDNDYYTDYREWGCTTSLETCDDTCVLEDNCWRNKSACCNAELYQLSGNYSDENHAAYQKCYYGAGTRVDLVVNSMFLVLSILILDWLVRWGRGVPPPFIIEGVLTEVNMRLSGCFLSSGIVSNNTGVNVLKYTRLSFYSNRFYQLQELFSEIEICSTVNRRKCK